MLPIFPQGIAYGKLVWPKYMAFAPERVVVGFTPLSAIAVGGETLYVSKAVEGGFVGVNLDPVV
jgi:hypothetical protein